MATFYNLYQHLSTIEPGVPFLASSLSPAHLVIPRLLGNRMHGETHGLELAATYTLLKPWKVVGSYSWLRGRLHPEPVDGGLASFYLPGDNPANQFHLRSYVSLPRNFEVDTHLSAIGELETRAVPAYLRLNTRLGWRPPAMWKWSLVLQNLLDARHVEFIPRFEEEFTREVKRGFYSKVTWRF